MAHIHEKIDFTVNAFLVYNNTILMVSHKELGIWLPVGGHIELDEDPEEALRREVKEESGISDFEIVDVNKSRVNLQSDWFRSLPSPLFLDIHKITESHRHVGLNYVCRALSNKVVLNKKESKDIRWFTLSDLDDAQYEMPENIRYYAKEALRIVS